MSQNDTHCDLWGLNIKVPDDILNTMEGRKASATKVVKQFSPCFMLEFFTLSGQSCKFSTKQIMNRRVPASAI
jgi:hypothetical protein